MTLGVVVVLVGAFDVSSRVLPALNGNLGVIAFAPGIAALDPSVLNSILPAPRATTTPLTPVRLTILSLGVGAAVEAVGVKEGGAMANPSSFTTTGWYKYGARPGEAGNAVIAGHVNNGLGLSGVFARLPEIAIGATITVTDNSGRTLNYVVVEKTQYSTTEAPLQEIFSITGPSQLVLITCEGDWIPASRSYDKRLVVLARLAP
jgi:hypothetical protein